MTIYVGETKHDIALGNKIHDESIVNVGTGYAASYSNLGENYPLDFIFTGNTEVDKITVTRGADAWQTSTKPGGIAGYWIICTDNVSVPEDPPCWFEFSSPLEIEDIIFKLYQPITGSMYGYYCYKYLDGSETGFTQIHRSIGGNKTFSEDIHVKPSSKIITGIGLKAKKPYDQCYFGIIGLKARVVRE